MNIRPATPSFRRDQFYLEELGVDVARRYPGGDGEGINILDIENGWQFDHEDVSQDLGSLLGGTMATSHKSKMDHGTAVMGVLCGDQNDYGIEGIAPRATFYGRSAWSLPSSIPIRDAADRLRPGDVMLIELHVPGPATNGRRHPEQFWYVPVEHYDHAFDAVSYAVSKDIVVVEAAGNGAQDLDDALYGGKFDTTVRDSGAILVGACTRRYRRESHSNHGTRVDAHGFGESVYTTGYGDLWGLGDPNREYTRRFRGTSSASPMVAGAASLVNAVRKAHGKAPYGPFEMRDLFRNQERCRLIEGIGRFPDLRHILKPELGIPDYDDDDRITFSDFLALLKTAPSFSQFLAFRRQYGKTWPDDFPVT